ncbi:MAG: response regulator transcription factor [Gloeobacteraceae cyanobacterium ES-bin-316]|nr:response regulator transcription factor [Ferruginibacter sp.]
MKINCIVIDDEPLARKGMKEYIQDVNFLHFAGEFESPLKASVVLNRKEVQLLFLDIQMPKISGIDFLRTIEQPPPVIFTTAYPQYALEGFELNALDYLVKPISFERFLKAANKAKEYYELRKENQIAGKEAAPLFVFIKVDGKLVKIFFSDILFVEAMQNYVAIHTSEKKYTSYLTLYTLAEYLPPDDFLKTHKSFIVAINKVESIEGNQLKIGMHQIPVSRTIKEEVMGRLLGKQFIKR